MITVISGTNREDNETHIFARQIFKFLTQLGAEEVCYLDLVAMPANALHINRYNSDQQALQIAQWQDQMLIPSDKFWFVLPEYNGSFPGVLKVFIDAVSIRNIPETFGGKKACLTGISSGRAGNLRGMDHLSDVLNHLGTIVLPNKLPISQIEQVLNGKEQLIDRGTQMLIKNHVEEFLAF